MTLPVLCRASGWGLRSVSPLTGALRAGLFSFHRIRIFQFHLVPLRHTLDIRCISVTGDRFENLPRRSVDGSVGGLVSGNAKIWAVWVDFGMTVTSSFVNRSTEPLRPLRSTLE